MKEMRESSASFTGISSRGKRRSNTTSVSDRGLLLLGILLAFGSGVSALVYEVVWFQVLELVIGSTAVSLGILLATFMGGMCLGSWLFPRVFSDSHRPLRVYALIELGIGLFGLVVLRLIPLAGSVYTAW